jgi:hypothetical protein
VFHLTHGKLLEKPGSLAILIRSSFIFLEISVVNTMMAADNRIVTVAAVMVIIITCLVFHKFLDWKSSILYCIR